MRLLIAGAPMVVLAAVVLMLPCVAQADFIDNFDGTEFDARWGLDMPNPALGDITLDTANDWAHFQAYGNTDMWGSRNNAPILWTDSPAGDFFIETHVMSPASQNGSVAGLTVYDNADNSKPNFTLGLDQWGGPLVKLQGLGNNNPNISTSIPGGEAWLRLELYRDGNSTGLDRYVARYKLAEADPWTPLAVLDRDVANARMGLVMKTSGAGRTSDFSYVASGEPLLSPEPGELWSVNIRGSGSNDTPQGVEQVYGYGNMWNDFTVAHHSGTSTNLSLDLVNSEGDATAVKFSVLGTVSGYNNGGDALRSDYLFVRAGNADTQVDWEISGLSPGEIYEMFAYGGPGRSIVLTVDNTAETLTVGTTGALFADIEVDVDGLITGTAAGPNSEGNWSGFQLRQVSGSAVPEPSTWVLLALGGLGFIGFARRKRR